MAYGLPTPGVTPGLEEDDPESTPLWAIMNNDSIAYVKGVTDDHETRIDTLEAGGGSVPDASSTVKGIVELATTAETTTGTDTVRAVTPAGVAAVAVTKKTDSMATNKLLGRGTSGTGVIEEITLGTNLSLTGTTLNASGGGGGSGDVVGPGSATDNAVARFDATTGKLVQNSVVTISDAGAIATPSTVDGRDVSVDGTKLDGIASGATANQSDATTNAAIALKAPIASPTFTGTVSGVTKAHVGLGNVVNTAVSLVPAGTSPTGYPDGLFVEFNP